MAGFTPDEGEQLIAEYLYGAVTTDRAANMQLGLFTTAAPTETITEATIAEPTGGGYARKTLTDGTWSNVAGVSSYALQTFTVTGTDYSADIYGYFVATNGITQRLIAVEIDGNGPYTMTVDDTYDITLNITQE